MQAFNQQGNTTSQQSFVTITFPSRPCCSFNFKIVNIRATQLNVKWMAPTKLNGLDTIYFINVHQLIDPNGPLIASNLVNQINSSVTIKSNDLIQKNKQLIDRNHQNQSNYYFQQDIVNLNAYQLYLISIKACNKEPTNNTFYCLDGTGLIDPNFKSVQLKYNFIQLIMSQDRPEQQPEPVLVSINSSYAVIGVI